MVIGMELLECDRESIEHKRKLITVKAIAPSNQFVLVSLDLRSKLLRHFDECLDFSI